MAVPLTASSSTSGFFQDLPVLPPQYTALGASPSSKDATSISDDIVLARILDIYLPSSATLVGTHIHNLARLSLHPSVLKNAVDAETNHPVLKPLTTFGLENKFDPLWTTTGWQALKEIGYREGVVAVAYEDAGKSRWNRRIYSFGLGHVWIGAATMTGCPMSMTDGAATLLARHIGDEDGDQVGRREVFKEAYRRLTSRDPATAWTSGQWMTERTGGSDVSGTETVARRLSVEELSADTGAGRTQDAVGMPLGPWKVDGFKWFSSATDSEMAVLLARTSKGGLSAFYIPMRRRTGKMIPSINADGHKEPLTELNGVRIQRLKNKLGTKSLPTAELELRGTRGWLIGIEGQGVKEISAILNITRLSTAAGSAGYWSRGLAICRAYSKVRKVRGGLLRDNPQHLRWMADETVKYWAATQLTFFGVALQGALEQKWDDIVRGTKAEALIPREKIQIQTLLRLLTPVMKAQVSVSSVEGMRECMECLGGVGYCENNEEGGLFNMAKIFRDNLVNPIWEGTVSVMAEDVVRVLTDKRLGGGNVIGNLLAPWVFNVLKSADGSLEQDYEIVKSHLKALLALIKKADREELLYRGREILGHLEVVVTGCLLIHDAMSSKEDVARAVAERWIRSKSLEPARRNSRNWRMEVDMDKRIFLGDEGEAQVRGKL
ncbi:hypothetical protein BDV96DRAFT_592222 [Lophiotrema nucula]|uniref:Acyl-CoA dehydrogenase/oxidase n=1 Tax=Lophiotrema nucula TaxID=690887 RepID=A0A6A5YEP1_9PLEO|nr:hypothetical protein BDV96DRAFT_592222 [Lophiotrema nucula]